MRLASLIAPPAALLVLLAGCGHGGSTSSSSAASTAARPASRAHAAPDLERLLPAKVAGVRFVKRSATGAAVLRGDAFSRSLSSFLRSVGKAPQDLRFANARDAARRADLELGVFELRGVGASRLLQAIVTATKPNAPGLKVGQGTLGGKRVTKLTYPGGSTLYLHGSGERVFYAGTADESLAAKALRKLP